MSISSPKLGEELLLSLERLGPLEVEEDRLKVLAVVEGDTTVHWRRRKRGRGNEGEGEERGEGK